VLVSEGLAVRVYRATETEADLVRQAQAGARDAFDALVAQHATAVVRTAYTILGSQEEADDVAQETFMAAYRNLGHYRHDAPFGAWLHRIAVNRSYDVTRRHQRQTKLIDEIAAGSSGSDEEDALRQARTQEQGAQVRELIAGLDEVNRAIVALRFLQDMSIKQIAATLEMPEGTIKRRLHDVLKVLRRRVAEGALG